MFVTDAAWSVCLLFAGTRRSQVLAQTAAPAASNSSTIGPVVVTSPKRKPVKRAGAETARTRVHARTAGRTRATTARPRRGRPTRRTKHRATPLNSNVVATSASRLGLTAFEMPASVEIVDQQTMQEQGYRTTTETAQGAVGVLAGDSGGAFGSFSMRGFTDERDQYPLQRHLDRPERHHLARHGYVQSRPRGVP